MKDIKELLEGLNRPPLLIGKGPSFSLIEEISLEHWTTIALNHAIRETKADLCNIIDIDVVEDLGEVLYEKAEKVCLPFFPHVNFNATGEPLHDFVEKHSALKKMEEEGRLYTYHLDYSKPVSWKGIKVLQDFGKGFPLGYPTPLTTGAYRVRLNNGDTFFGILAANGFKVVHSVGVDGGQSYNKSFSDLTPLTNGRASFDDQDPSFEEIKNATGCKLVRISEWEKPYIDQIPKNKLTWYKDI